MKTEVKKVFEGLCRANDEILQREDVVPICFVINANGIQPIVLDYSKGKDDVRNGVKRMLAMSKLLGYVIITDCKMTIIDRSTGKAKSVQDAVMRTLYTTQGAVRNIVIYDGKTRKIISTEEFVLPRDEHSFDEWDLWGGSMNGENKEHQKIYEWYNKIRDENPQEYKDCKDFPDGVKK